MTELFGLNFQQLTFDKAVDFILDTARERTPRLLVTPNVDHIILINRDPFVKTVFQSADILVADGMPIVWFSRLIPKKSLPERITGADLMPALCEKAAHRELRVGFIGSSNERADKALAVLRKKSPNLLIAGHYSPPLGFENDPKETQKIIELCRKWNTNILFLCLGTPKQEKWAYTNLKITDVNCGVVACVGAALDMLSGEVLRAPKFIQNAGLEWVWRLMLEPKRLWRRYLLNDPLFIYYGAKELFSQITALYKAK